MTGRIVIWILPLALACACGDEKKAQEPATGGAAVKTGAPMPPSTPPADAAPAAPPDLTGGLPPIALASPSPEAASQAAKLNKEALVLHRAGKLDEAAAAYRSALAVDPSHLIARYNLASSLATKGDAPQALAILAQFAGADVACAGCAERLARARNDGEWKALWGDPEFQRITGARAPAPRAQVIFLAFASPTAAAEEEPRDDGGATTVAFVVELEPPPGWVQAPAIEVDIAAGGKSIAKKAWRPDQVKGASLSLEFPAPESGTVTATAKADGVVVGTVKAKAAQLQPDSFTFTVVPSKRRAAKVARCDGIDCPDFPALSPDGKTLAVYDSDELISPGDICNPPVATRTRFFRVGKGDLDLAPSQDLAGYEVLACDPGEEVKLKDRFTVVHDADASVVALRDPSGVEITRAEAYGNGVMFCQSATHRVVVVQIHGAVGGDCDEVGGDEYLTFRY